MCVLGSMTSNAITVHFGDMDRGPSDTLQIGDVTVSQDRGQPATVSGSGLGAASLGRNDSIDFVAHYSVGQAYPDNGYGANEKLCFTVLGSFTSITLVPHFPVVLETEASVDSEFAWFGGSLSWSPGGLGSARAIFYPTNTGPKTITLDPVYWDAPINRLDVRMDCESAGYPLEFQILYSYRLAHLSEEQTIQCGFTILSVDYVIPEPGTTALLGIGLLGLSCAGWKFRRTNVHRPR